jgi:hypothetical protein
MRTVLAGLAIVAWLVPAAASAQQQQRQQQQQPRESMQGYTDGFDDFRDPERRQRINPIEREEFDEVVERMFAAADASRDGIVTLSEFQGVIAGRKEQAIQARFAAIDANRDRSVTLEEFGAWQRGLGSAVLSDARGGGAEVVVAEVIAPDARGDDGLFLNRLIEPLGSTVVTAANTDFDAGTSRAELVAYEGKRFEALDLDHDNELTPDELPDPRAPRDPPPAAPPVAAPVR